MECFNNEIKDEDHQQESRDSEAHEKLEGTESDDDGSDQGETSSSDELFEEEENDEEWKVAHAVTRVALEGFNGIYWDWWAKSFVDHRKVFKKFKKQVFQAMAWFVFTLYNKEDFENIAFASNISDECKTFGKLNFAKGNPISWRIDMRSFKYLHEQDIGNMIQHYKSEAPSNETKLMQDFSGFQSEILLHPNSSENDEIYLHKYVRYTKELIKNHIDVIEEKVIKRHLLMELNDCKCFCIMDSLYMMSWKRIPLESLKESVSTMVLEDLVSNIHTVLYDLAMRRIERLHNCERLVTQTLSMFGSFDSNVIRVVEWADLERRTQGRRFISTDDLRRSLNKMKVVGQMELQYSKSSDEYTVHHVYQRSQEIAKHHGYQTIGVKQLCQALRETDISGVSSPKIETRIKKHQDDVDETSTPNKLWKRVDKNNDGTRLIKDSVLAVVAKIQNPEFFPLEETKEAVKQLYSKQSRPTRYSLKSRNLSLMRSTLLVLKKRRTLKNHPTSVPKIKKGHCKLVI